MFACKRNLAIGGAVLAMSLAGAGLAQAKTFTLATDRVGSTFNAMGTGVAATITGGGQDRVIVRAFGGPEAYLRPLQDGDIDLAVQSASSAYGAFNGENPQKIRYTGMRLLRAGVGGLRLTFVVPEKSGIKSIADLKGRRVASSYGGHATIPPSIAGALATAGLTWDDVVQVPVTGVLGGIEAIEAGRAEASWSSYGMPASRQLHTKIGIRYLPFERTEESLKVLRDNMFPGVQLVMTKAEPAIGMPADGYLISYESYIITGAKTSDEDVKRIMETLWERTPDLRKAHRGLDGFTHDAAASTIPMIPYHPAAIAFYKDKGVWTDEHQKAHDALMAKVQ